MQITIIKQLLNEKQAIALEACKKNIGKKKSIQENLKTAEQEGRQAKKDGKKSSECPYGEEGSWDEKHSRTAWHKGYNSKNESLDEAVSKDYEAAAKLAHELTVYANSLHTNDVKSQEAHYKAFEAHFKAYDLAHTDAKHKDHLKKADSHLTQAGHTLSEMANSGYVSGLQKSVNTLQAHLKRHGLEHTFTQQHVNKTLKSLGHSAQITHHNGMDDIRKVTDNNKAAPTAAEMIVRHLSVHTSKNESLDENIEHEFIKNELAKKDINVIRIEKHRHQILGKMEDGLHHVVVDKESKGATEKLLKKHGLDKEYLVKTNESLDESELLTFHLKHRDHVEKAIDGIGHSSFSDRDGHNIRYEKKDEPRIKQAIAKAGLVPASDDKFKSNDNIRTTDFDKVQATAAKVKKRSDIKKALARKMKNKNESDEDFEAHLISESVDVDAIRKLSAAIKANPEIENALFQLISAIMTNPKMFEANPSSVVNKIAASSKVPATKLQSVVDALGL